MEQKPQFFDSADALPTQCTRVDLLERSCSELYRLDHPDQEGGAAVGSGVWAYFPWAQHAVHIPGERDYYRLLTSRNRGLILDVEQERYRSARVGIAGLSVGSAALAAIVATGGPKRLRIADPDRVDISNLNRMRAHLLDVSELKTTVAARNAWLVDPFLDLEVFETGITDARIVQFTEGLSVFVDEMDSIPMKVRAREVCKERSVPVVMATDNGDGAILDVERFDLEPERAIFHGRVELEARELSALTKAQFAQVAAKIIDPTLFTSRQREANDYVGKTLPSVPQIATGASIAGAAVAAAVRAICCGQPLPSGRYALGVEEALQAPKAVTS